MMITIKQIFFEIWHVYLDVSVFMLFGFFVAALLHVFFKADKIKNYLGKGRVKPVLLSALVGIPIPLCSCGVIPVVAGLKRQGANDGAALAFMIATPESGVDSIAVSWAMLDPVMTIIRPIAGFVTAISTGIAENYLNSRKAQIEKSVTPDPFFNVAASSGCSCSSCGAGDAQDLGQKIIQPPLFQRLMQGLNFAFGDLLTDISKPFAIGVLIAGVITFFFPAELGDWSRHNTFLSMLVMLVAGIPMYVCATSSTPIAAALILKGLNPGAVLVFLLAGPATNVATMGMVKNIFSTRALVIYLSMIALCSMVMGYLLDLSYRLLDIRATAVIGKAGDVIPHNVELAAALVLAGLLLRNMFMHKHDHGQSHNHEHK